MDGAAEARKRAAEGGGRHADSGRPNLLDANAAPQAANAAPQAPFQQQLDQIDLELSAMIVEDPNFWDLGGLKQRAEQLFNQAESAAERGRARMMVSKINRFEDIKRRKQALAAGRPESPGPIPRPPLACRRPTATAASTPRGN